MKKLITIFVSSIMGVCLWGQAKLPMTIVGDVYIANTGQMLSVGTVHLQAISGNKVANVANYGTLTMDSAIFYSNDSIEGLLMNKQDGDTVPVVDVPGKGVSVRKTFTKNNSWYQVSLPFDVNLNGGVVNPITGKTMRYYANDYPNSDFYIQYYDAQKRAKIGMNVDTIWQMLPSTETQIKKGTGYRIAIKMVKLIPGTFVLGSNTLETDTIGGGAGRFAVDFFADNTEATNIDDLFAMKPKGVSLTYYPATFLIAPENSEGWNAIGGLNSTNYLLKGATVNFTDPIYGYTDSTQWGDPFNPEDPDDFGTLRPYAVFFVQTTSSTVLNYNGNSSGGFSFKGDGSGLVLAADPALPVFRSATTPSYDLFKVQLTGVKNNFTSRVYFKFNDSYTQTFKTSEGDRVLLQTTMPSLQSVWAVAQNENNVEDQTFINCLPYNVGEIPLGVNIPVAGEYIFSLKSIAVDKGISTVVLMDNATGIETDLLKSDYDIQVSSTLNTENRFVLFINKTITSVDQVTTPDIYAYAENNVITVKNLNSGDKVQVLDLTGRIIASGIASGNMYSTPVNQKGVYIINAKDGAKVLKVLNK